MTLMKNPSASLELSVKKPELNRVEEVPATYLSVSTIDVRQEMSWTYETWSKPL